ncbi:MAG: efflux RND transporter permease subunit [Polyangiaceae bacterium]
MTAALARWCRLLAVTVTVPAGCAREHGHSHADDHGEAAHAAEEAPAAVAITRWTPRYELFVELPPPSPGKPVPYHAHVTRLADFQAVTEGTFVVRFRTPAGVAAEATQSGVKRPGIFVFESPAPAAGTYALEMAYTHGGETDVFDCGAITVADAAPPAEEASVAAITFLKESQWKIPFGTAWAEPRPLARELELPATVEPASSDQLTVGAPTGGRFFHNPKLALAEGLRIAKGDVVGTIAPTVAGDDFSRLQSGAEEARIAKEQTAREIARIEPLVKQGLLPDKRLIELQNELDAQTARAASAAGRLGRVTAPGGEGGIPIKSSLAGVVSRVLVPNGEPVEAGAALVRIAGSDHLWLRTRFVAKPAAALSDAVPIGARLSDGGRVDLTAMGAKFLSPLPIVDGESRVATWIVDVLPAAGAATALRAGASVVLRVRVGAPQTLLAVPAEAVTEINTRPYVFVQLDGEHFDKRAVVVGQRDGDWVHLVSGVKAGERVVSRGGFDIHLASLMGTIESHRHRGGRRVRHHHPRFLRHPWLVVAAALVLVGVGLFETARMPLDVLPELSAPSVTVVTEANGLAPEEVEKLVTVPLEQALNGASGLRRIRSSSAIGISLIWVEFEWDADPRVARQVVAEKLTSVRGALPADVEPTMAPASSIMGEIMFVGLTGDDGVSAAELRDVAEWVVRRRLLGVPGIAQVVPIGGDVKQVEIVLSPERLMQNRVGVEEVLATLAEVSESTPGGFHVAGQQEYLIRGVGRLASLEELGRTVVRHRQGVATLLEDVADLRYGQAIRRGAAALDGKPAVVMKIQKQPQANTLELTGRLDAALDGLAGALPPGMSLYRKGFRQADFIRVALDNVMTVLRDGAILVVIVLALFLMSWRTTLISLLALPLSLLAGLLVLRHTGASINTMTLGGFAIAIGELVDDAIIDVENVYRRLRENALRPEPERRPAFDVVCDASREIRSSVVYATAIILLVFAPLFFLSGIEGRLLRPLGIAYVTSIGASLIVALTITPVLCLLLLGRNTAGRAPERDGLLARHLKGWYRPLVRATMRVPIPVAIASIVGAAGAIAALASFGRSFLPEFNEGSLNIAAATAPGTSLSTSDRIVSRLERFLVEHRAVTSVIRSTGRAERDEHAMDVNFSELEVGLKLDKGEREAVIAEIREQASSIPGLTVTVGQPISHRIEHLVSGVRASLAVKIFGNDLDQLRTLARQSEAAMKSIPGLVDIGVEQQTEIPQLVIRPKPTELAAFGQTPGQLARFVEMAFVGRTVSTWWEEERVYNVVAKLPDAYREDLELLATTPLDVGGQRFTELSAVAQLQRTTGPNLVNRENLQRRIVITANIADRDLRGAAEEVRATLVETVPMPAGYHLELGGEFESEAAASRTILGLSLVALLGMAALLFLAFGSARDALLVMFNLPLALVGGTAAVWLSGGDLNVASLVGFITLFGIATRNGIMMVTHFRHLMVVEGLALAEAVLQGSVDRLVPILMTALTAALALVPIVLAAGEPGNEIQAPMAAVILGGLLSSTLLNLLVVPPLFARFAVPSPAPAAAAPTGHVDVVAAGT